MTRAPHPVVIALAALVAGSVAACAPPRANLTADVLARMQHEARVEIYDRENDVFIAMRRRGDAAIALSQLEKDKDGEGAAEKRLAERLEKAGRADRVAQLQPRWKARRDWIEARLRRQRGDLVLADEQSAGAIARLEQTRQRQLVRTGRALAEQLVPFDQRIERVELRLKELERKQQDLQIDEEKSFDAWKAAEDADWKASGDYDTGVWSDR